MRISPKELSRLLLDAHREDASEKTWEQIALEHNLVKRELFMDVQAENERLKAQAEKVSLWSPPEQIRKDAELGRLVRNMPNGQLVHEDDWWLVQLVAAGASLKRGETPQEVLRAAGVKEEQP